MTNILGIIIARGGSKGLPKKNIKILGDKPLLAWSILEAKKSKLINRLILSTEDEEIKRVALDYDIDVPFKRPKSLSRDKTHTPDVLIHALNKIEKIDKKKYDLVVLLQPTVPFRKAKIIDKCIKHFLRSKHESLITIQKQEYPPWWMLKTKKSKLLPAFKLNTTKNVNVFNMERQEFPVIYKPNGSVYITWSKLLRNNRQLVNPQSCGYLIDNEENHINIDNHKDFYMAEIMLKNKSSNQ